MTSGPTDPASPRRRGWALALAASGLAVGVLACPHHAVALNGREGAAVPPVRFVPRGCEGPLAGDYVHAQNRGYHYRGLDDGGTLTLTVLREGADAGAGLLGDPADTRVVLTRSAHGFTGASYSAQLPESEPGSVKRRCPIAVPTEVIGCDDGGLTLRAQEKVWVGPGCESPSVTPPVIWLEQRLVHAPATAAPPR